MVIRLARHVSLQRATIPIHVVSGGRTLVPVQLAVLKVFRLGFPVGKSKIVINTFWSIRPLSSEDIGLRLGCERDSDDPLTIKIALRLVNYSKNNLIPFPRLLK